MSAEEGTGKRKLTLSVDEEVVKRAKALGLNLSEITESVLRGFAFAPGRAARGSMYARYKELFGIMQPLLRDYDTSVEVSRWSFVDEADPAEIESVVYLTPSGILTKYDSEVGGFPENDTVEDVEIEQIPLDSFLSPKDLVGKFITAIAKAKEDREERVEELEMAKRIIAAIDLRTGEQAGKPTPQKEKGK